jgi:hypothetical protein
VRFNARRVFTAWAQPRTDSSTYSATSSQPPGPELWATAAEMACTLAGWVRAVAATYAKAADSKFRACTCSTAVETLQHVYRYLRCPYYAAARTVRARDGDGHLVRGHAVQGRAGRRVLARRCAEVYALRRGGARPRLVYIPRGPPARCLGVLAGHAPSSRRCSARPTSPRLCSPTPRVRRLLGPSSQHAQLATAGRCGPANAHLGENGNKQQQKKNLKEEEVGSYSTRRTAL